MQQIAAKNPTQKKLKHRTMLEFCVASQGLEP